mmetsp:Transcript_17509/g.70926  ORF Transcript_17509/g.70926 Transcript_17509/m.70926 type:complete len:103 (+) Transcript_17509:981-1289(+)
MQEKEPFKLNDNIGNIDAGHSRYGTYRRLWSAAMDNPDKNLEDAFFEYEVYLAKQAFDQQFHYAIFYAYLRLKEQEIRNIGWIAECISQKNKSKLNKYIVVF